MQNGKKNNADEYQQWNRLYEPPYCVIQHRSSGRPKPDSVVNFSVDSARRPATEHEKSNRRRLAVKHPLVLLHELTQHVRQNAVVAIVLRLVGRVDPSQHGERRLVSTGSGGGDIQARAWLNAAGDALDIVALLAREPKRFRVSSGLKLQRQHAHADEIAAVNALKTLSDYRVHAQQT